VAAAHIDAGQTITEQLITFKRPGTGIAPGDAHRLIGMRARRDLESDAILNWDDVEDSEPILTSLSASRTNA
jgi:N-acetylneuraminate synthase